MTLETFAHYWYNYIVPSYNNHSYRGRKSPHDRYLSLPEAKTIVPDWNTLAIFLHKKKAYEVRPEGITIDGVTYNHPKLDEFRGTNKKVLVYRLDAVYKGSIFVLYSDAKKKDCRFICEAYPADILDLQEKDLFKLHRNLILKARQRRLINDTIQSVDYLTHKAGLKMTHYIDQDPVVTSTVFGEVPVTHPDTNSVIISEAAMEASIAEMKTLERLMRENLEDQRKKLYAGIASALRNGIESFQSDTPNHIPYLSKRN
ncbi:MAG: hypothetical protein IJ757_01105 [Clostridiales bacterium]|nr:hypothetical protein [Clostridiales bacterium]